MSHKQSKEHIAKRIESRRRNNPNYFSPGYVPWNKGKTKETDTRVKEYALKAIKGKKMHSAGYVEIYSPEHPISFRGYVFEHIIVAEKKIGRHLYQHEQVHHKNGNKADNRPSNLRIMTRSEHSRMHMMGKQHRLGHAPWNKGMKGTDKARKAALKAWETKRKKVLC